MDFAIEKEWAIQATSCTTIIIFIITFAVGFPTYSVISLMEEFMHLSPPPQFCSDDDDDDGDEDGNDK